MFNFSKYIKCNLCLNNRKNNGIITSVLYYKRKNEKLSSSKKYNKNAPAFVGALFIKLLWKGKIKMKKILLVEDNETIIMGLKYTLEQENFQVDSAPNIVTAIAKMNKQQYDIYLLDISLPDGEGYEICKKIKEKENLPVIFLTARDEETDVVQGLDMGADDYVVKPFRTRELISRINSVLRRYEKNTSIKKQIKCQNIVIDDNIAKVYKNDEEIFLTSLDRKSVV